MRNPSWSIPLLIVCLGESVDAGTVHRRGGLPDIQGTIIAMDDAGISIRSNGSGVKLILWDQVRDIIPDQPDPSIESRLEIAEDLWRARSRITRGDLALAEPLLERLFERYRGKSNETALIVAEGLLRCRLDRGANLIAVIPFLEIARLHRKNIGTDRYAQLEIIYDQKMSLCPLLAPIWIDREGSQRLIRDLEAYDSGEDEVIDALVILFRQAALPAKQRQMDKTTSQLPRHPGIDFLRRLLETSSPDSQKRQTARLRLNREIDDLPDWAESWIRYQIGLSLLAEVDEDQHQLGLVNLAHLPSRYSTTNPYLAGLALAGMIETLESRGNLQAAASLRSELERRFPGHPGLSKPIREENKTMNNKEGV